METHGEDVGKNEMYHGRYVHDHDGDVPMDPDKDESCGGDNITVGSYGGAHNDSID